VLRRDQLGIEVSELHAICTRFTHYFLLPSYSSQDRPFHPRLDNAVHVDIDLVLGLPPSENRSNKGILDVVQDTIVVMTRCSVAALGKV
jgi:hypothetical protein